MKTRILKRTNPLGNITYHPQRRFLYFFWENLGEGWHDLDSAKTAIRVALNGVRDSKIKDVIIKYP